MFQQKINVSTIRILLIPITVALFLSCGSESDNKKLLIGSWKATTGTSSFNGNALPSMAIDNFYCSFTENKFIEYTMLDGEPDTSIISTYNADKDSIYIEGHSVGPQQNFGYSFSENKTDILILKNNIGTGIELKTTYKRINH